jgi:hypothetical protein
MSRHLFSTAVLAIVSLVACDSSDKDDTGEDSISVDVEQGILPQSGEWPIVTTGWSADDCNAEEGLYPPTSILFAEVDATSFMTTYYDEYGQVGNTTVCSFDTGDTYNCEGFTNGFTYPDMDATISLTGGGPLTLASETEASGSGNFTLDCTGSDCDTAAMWTNSGSFPCITTLNWTAQAVN